MVSADSLETRLRTESDIAEIVQWVPSAEDLYLFSGTRLQWPLTNLQLSGMQSIASLTAWSCFTSSEELIGHFDLTLSEHLAQLGRVILKPAYRGSGLAVALVQRALERAQDSGASRVNLNVIANNAPAIRTYLRVGFVIDSEAAHRIDVLGMTKDLQ